MFNAVIPLDPPIFAVHVDPAELQDGAGAEMLRKAEAYFMSPVVLVAWDRDARFFSLGAPCPPEMLLSEDLHWRRFELPQEPDLPF